jgi:hypothetical protein
MLFGSHLIKRLGRLPRFRKINFIHFAGRLDHQLVFRAEPPLCILKRVQRCYQLCLMDGRVIGKMPDICLSSETAQSFTQVFGTGFRLIFWPVEIRDRRVFGFDQGRADRFFPIAFFQALVVEPLIEVSVATALIGSG